MALTPDTPSAHRPSPAAPGSESGHDLLRQARVLEQQGAIEPALILYRRARRAFLLQSQVEPAADCDLALARALDARGRLGAAVAAYARAGQEYLKSGGRRGTRLAAACAISRGRSLASLGWLPKGVAACEEARALFEQAGDHEGLAHCEVELGRLLTELGRYGQAELHLESARNSLVAMGTAGSLPDCWVALAGLRRRQGRASDALELVRRGLDGYSSPTKRRDRAWAAILEAILLRDRGEGVRSFTKLDSVRETFELIGDPVGVEVCVLEQAEVLVSRRLHRRALGLFERSAAFFAETDRPALLLRAHCGIGRCLRETEQTEEALRAYLRACEALDVTLQRLGRDDTNVGGLRGQLPDPFAQAAVLLLEAAAAREHAGHPVEARSLRSRALWLTERGRSANLRREMLASSVSDEVATTPAGRHILARWRVLHRRLAETDALLHSQEYETMPSEHQQPADVRQRILVELDATEAQLFDAEPEAASLLTTRVPSLSMVSRTVGGDEGLLILASAGDDLLRFLLDRQGLVAADLVPRGMRECHADLVGLASQIAQCEESGGPLPGMGRWSNELRSLGDRLLGSAALSQWLNHRQPPARLTIVPCGGLYSVPYAALMVPGAPKDTFLVERCEVSLAPQVATRFYQRLKSVKGRGALAVVNPDGTLALGGEEALMLEKELQHLLRSRQRADEEVTVRSSVTADGFAAAAGGKRYLHLACHGRFEPQAPLESALILAPDTPRGLPTYITARRLFSLPDRFELVFAGACETGRSLVLAGDGLLGLTRALLYLSRCVVSALWRVNERSTLDLTRLFYSELATSGDPISALAHAQRIMIDRFHPDCPRGRGYEPAHPFHWSSLVAWG